MTKINMRKKIFQTILLSLVIFLLSCAPQAPHENPLDPYHVSSGIGFSGQVLQKIQPHNPLSKSLIFLLPEQKFDTTNAEGLFQFEQLQPGPHQLIIEHEGYVSDTVAVDPDTMRQNPAIFYLNGRPYLTQTKVYSEFIDQWWPDPVTFVKFEITIADPDGASDITSATLQIPKLNLYHPFQATVKPDSLFLQLSETDISRDSLFQLAGLSMQIRLTDTSEDTEIFTPFYLIRIIDVSPVTTAPSGLQTADPRPLLQWQAYAAPFAFTYEIGVYVLTAGLPVRIHQTESITPDQLEYQYPDSLPTGTYFWTVGIRDDLGNLSRSKEASFIVE